MRKIPFIFVLLGIFGLAFGFQIPTSANLSESDLVEILLVDHAKHGKLKLRTVSPNLNSFRDQSIFT